MSRSVECVVEASTAMGPVRVKLAAPERSCRILRGLGRAGVLILDEDAAIILLARDRESLRALSTLVVAGIHTVLKLSGVKG